MEPGAAQRVDIVNSQTPHPPRWTQSLLRRWCKSHLLEEIEGDLLEFYHSWVEEYGVAKAKRLYIFHSIKFLRYYALEPILPSSITNLNIMLKDHLKIALRQLVKNRAYSFLNIFGLAIGMTVTLLIGLWALDEVSFNKYHKNYDRVAQVLQSQVFSGGEIQTRPGQALQLAPVLRDTYGAHFKYVTLANFGQDHTLRFNEKVLTQRGMFMEPDAPKILTLDMITGTLDGLKEPYSILLSASAASVFFGDEDPMNKVMQIDDRPAVKVTGVYADLPHNSTFANLDFISTWELYKQGLPGWLNWGNSWFQVLVQIGDQQDMVQASAAIRTAKKDRVSEVEGARFKPELFLHPMSKWHLYSRFEQGQNTGGRIQYVWMFAIIGVFVLVLVCINFMNLSTARSEKRAKEVGVRKAVGSGRGQLVQQFFVESLFLASLAFVLSLILVYTILPYFNDFAGKNISVSWLNPTFWLIGIGFTLFTGVLAGCYPALYLSSLGAIKALKGKSKTSRNAAVPSKMLVVVQFTVSVSLTIGTLIVFQQIGFVKDRPVGYNLDHLITVPIKNDDIIEHYEAFRSDLLQTGMVEEVSNSASRITQTFVTNSGFNWKGKESGMQDEFVTVRVTHEFGKTIGWQVIAGRDFSRDFSTDSLGLVINEAAASYLGFDDPVGEKIEWGIHGTYTIIGVVKDMVTRSPYVPAKQTLFFIDFKGPKLFNTAHIRLRSNSEMYQALAGVEMVFKKHDPLNPFEFRFIDQEYANKFSDEERVGKLSSVFAILAIVISCMGLFGMASYVAQQRTKEIGIRKVLGASITNLWRLMSKDFVYLVLLSCLLAVPLAYYLLDGWLQQFEYRAKLSPWPFLLAVGLALVITMLTVSFHILKAAIINPVNSLKSG